MLHCLTQHLNLSFVAKGKVFPDLTFEPFEHGSHGTIVSKVYKVLWIIVDNGYLKWSTNVPPFKLMTNEAECWLSCGVHFWNFKRQVENLINCHQATGHGYMQQYLAYFLCPA